MSRRVVPKKRTIQVERATPRSLPSASEVGSLESAPSSRQSQLSSTEKLPENTDQTPRQVGRSLFQISTQLALCQKTPVKPSYGGYGKTMFLLYNKLCSRRPISYSSIVPATAVFEFFRDFCLSFFNVQKNLSRQIVGYA